MTQVKLLVIFFLSFISLSCADVKDEVRNFRMQAIGNINQQFNNLQSDVYGHFHRSQTTLRIARQNLYTTASSFPYYRLSDETRKGLTTLLSSLIYTVIDPTVEYVQKNSMDKFYAFNTDSANIVEQTFSAADTQLNAITSMNCSNNANITSRKLMTEYSNFISSISNCTRNVFQQYRAPINEFTRVHFIALPLINRLNRDLNFCTSPLNRAGIENCTVDYIKNNCQEETCKVNPTIFAVKEQAEKMVKDGSTEYTTCLNKSKDSLPANPSYLRDDNCNTL